MCMGIFNKKLSDVTVSDVQTVFFLASVFSLLAGLFDHYQPRPDPGFLGRFFKLLTLIIIASFVIGFTFF